LNKCGYKVVKTAELLHFSNRALVFENYIKFLLCLRGDDFDEIASVAPQAKSQIGQDLFVLYQTKCKREGYFVEFGATDGLGLSNTYLLEKEFGWKGILAEPAHIWHKDLHSNRSAHIETRCVWTTSNQKISFNETDSPMASTIPQFNDHDMHGETRKVGKLYEVETISLNDLLEKYSAPVIMDYLSIDTEGSELDILSSFNFDKYRFRVITVEHNWTENRQGISKLLFEKGYTQVFENVSQHDDWFVFADHNM
jgi:FkbM family methyltransferase